MAHHDLKAEPESFNLLALRTSQVQLRKNDRDFKIGDTCRFYEWNPVLKNFTGHTIRTVPIITILENHAGLTPGWCLIVLGLPTSSIGQFVVELAGKTKIPPGAPAG